MLSVNLSRRSLFASAAAIAATAAAQPVKACDHEWVCIGTIYRRGDDYHYACRGCQAEKIVARNTWVGDARREGDWTVPEYGAAFDYHPPKSRVEMAKRAFL